MTYIWDYIAKMKQEHIAKLSLESIQTVERFDRDNEFQGLKIVTRHNQVYLILKFLRDIPKELADVTKADLESYLKNLDVAPYSLETWKIILRKFFRWLGKPEFVDSVLWKASRNAYKTKKASDMLTEADIERMKSCARNLRDKAIIAVLWDTAIRNSELCNLNIGDVQSHGDYLSITVTGKTGSRTINLISSVSIMKEWLENGHPNKLSAVYPLFVSYDPKNHLGRLTTCSVWNIIKKTAERAGIQKHVHPHLLRHSKLTQLSRDGFNEMNMRLYSGWAPNSSMPSVYVHLSNADVNDKRLELETGTKVERITKSKLLDVECPRCKTKNDSSNRYCSLCGLPLGRDEISKDIGILELLRSDYGKKMREQMDAMSQDFNYLKAKADDMLALYNTGDASIQTIKQKLGWTDDRLDSMLSFLATAGQIDLDDLEEGRVKILDKSKFKQFIDGQKKYLTKKTHNSGVMGDLIQTE